MHAVQVNFVSDSRQRRAPDLLEAWAAMVDIAEAPVSVGAKVSVVQASARCERLDRNGVAYHFTPAAATPSDGNCHRKLSALMRELQPQILHVHGLGFPRQTLALAAAAPGVPILLQDHADRLPRFWRRARWRRGVAAAAGLAFCSGEQARPFRKAGLITERMPVYGIAESTSRFTPGDVAAARLETGLHGSPCILWVGHLDANKDPLTVMQGVSLAARTLPDLHMWCCFGRAPLLEVARNDVLRDPVLRHRVHLLGAVSHERVQALMRASDLLVSGSHREGSGFALIEALATGLLPVVTDIPSFRSLTGNGAVGRLWSRGEPRSLAEALVAAAAEVSPHQRVVVRAHFDRYLSTPALGRKLLDAYRQLAAGPP